MMPLLSVRIEPGRGCVVEPLLVRYEIQNSSRVIPAYDLHVAEIDATKAAGLEPAGEAWVLHVGPGDRVHAEAVFRPMRRGTLRLARFEVTSTFPFDLLRHVLIHTQPPEVLSAPEVQPTVLYTHISLHSLLSYPRCAVGGYGSTKTQ